MEKDVNKDDVRASEVTAKEQAKDYADSRVNIGGDVQITTWRSRVHHDLRNAFLAGYGAADQQTAALRKEVERLKEELAVAYGDASTIPDTYSQNEVDTEPSHKAGMFISLHDHRQQLSQLAETNKRLEEERDFFKEQNSLGESFIEEARAKLECGPKESLNQKISELLWELTTLRSEKGEGLANVLPTDEEIERMAEETYEEYPDNGQGGTELNGHYAIEIECFITGAKKLRDRLQNQSPEKSPPARQQ